MQSLLGGAECGTSSNPLKQVANREGVDNSLFKDRLAPTAGPSNHPNSAFRPSPQIINHQSPSTSLHATPHPFNLSHLSAALAQPPISATPAQFDGRAFDAQWEHARANGHSPIPNAIQARPQPSPAMRMMSPPPAQNSAWSNDFQSYSQSKGKSRAVQAPMTHIPPSNDQNGYPNHTPQYGYQPSFTPMYQGMIPQQPQLQQQPQYQNHAEVSQEQMENLFARAEEDYKAASANISDLGEQQRDSKGEERAEPMVEESGGVEDMLQEPKGDFEAVWESLRPEAERLNKLAEWESDFSQFTNDQDDLFETLNESLNRPEVGQTSLDEQMDIGNLAVPDGFDHFNQYDGIGRDDGIPRSRGYDFASSNIHDSSNIAALWAAANHILSAGGSLSEAGLMLESFVRRSTAQERGILNVSATEAWSLLGRVHAMDEKEDQALRAFEEGRKVLEQEGVKGKEGVAGEMLTNLAISYVNESLDLAALTVLHQYLSLVHPKHAGAAPSRSTFSETNASPWALHQSMAERFLNLAREQYRSNQSVDPDVQVGLGTLYYMMDNYEEARGCWTEALGERPDDYLLWNRLGATLANGGNSEEAVDAYRRALELKPTFTRAIFNLGVACLNIGVYKEAAEHLLAALSMHPPASQADSDVLSSDSYSIWSTLRRALVALGMNQLAGNAEPGTDLGVFREAGFDF
ncbi:uncharacterized protein IL334_000519 [Kwoniella shivajii]|uniref:Peroxin-5 n=1 Tax=Kwoniella shivajii TaxID=564305 RepID=A0ABZ1CPC2_9TREE|nr:hypothetical protein IL334_000519 [Kwoniella shivajii]